MLNEVKTPHPQGFCLEEPGGRIFVCTPKVGQISIVDRQKGDAASIRGNSTVLRRLSTWPTIHPRIGLSVGCRQFAKLLVLNSDYR